MYLLTIGVRVEKENQKNAETHFWRIRLIFCQSQRKTSHLLLELLYLTQSQLTESHTREAAVREESDPTFSLIRSSLLFKRNGVKRTHSDRRLKQSIWSILSDYPFLVPPPLVSGMRASLPSSASSAGI